MVALRPLIYGEGPNALDLGQADALDVLADCSPVRMAALAEALRVDASTATRAVNRLVERGLALRQRSHEDARVLQVALTEPGRRVHRELLRRRRATMKAILTGFSDSERAVLADLLERLVGGVDDMIDGVDRSVARGSRLRPDPGPSGIVTGHVDAHLAR